MLLFFLETSDLDGVGVQHDLLGMMGPHGDLQLVHYCSDMLHVGFLHQFELKYCAPGFMKS